MNTRSRLMLGALCASLMLLSSSAARAQSNARPPTQMTYQGFLTDANGLPFGSTSPVNKTVIFRIYDSLTGGTLKWSSQQVVTVDKGYFSVLLGQGSAVGSEPFTADLTGIFTGPGASDRYLELNADGTTIAPRLRFLPAPSAMLAKSATEVLDPVTGTTALTVNNGNLATTGTFTAANLSVTGNLTATSVSGSGANMTGLNASQITSGTLANARTTATSDPTANTLVTRDDKAGFSVEHVDARSMRARAAVDSHPQGAYLEWNKDWANGMTYLLNQKGNGTGGIVFGEATTGNDWQEMMRIGSNGNVGIGTTAPGTRLDVAGQVRADSVKLNGRDTLFLYSMNRYSALNNAPTPGMSVAFLSGGDNNVRGSNLPGDWWKSTQNYGTTPYVAVVTVPTGELWELEYHWRYDFRTDDYSGVVMSVNDVATDDAVTGLWTVVQGPQSLDQTVLLPAGTHTIRVRIVIGAGSGSDHIYFPWHTPNYVVIRKYRIF